MEIKLGKWEKGDMQRIYFNAPILGDDKIYAYGRQDGVFDVGRRVAPVPGKSKILSDVENAGVAEIEKLIGKPISYDTKFADVWAAVK